MKSRESKLEGCYCDKEGMVKTQEQTRFELWARRVIYIFDIALQSDLVVEWKPQCLVVH